MRFIRRILAVIWMVIKQMVNNWRLELSLLLGLTVAAAVVAAIPIYTSGALQWALMKQWPQWADGGRPPYSIMVSHWNRDYADDTTLEQFKQIDQFLKETVPDRALVPQEIFAQAGGLGIHGFMPDDPQREPAKSPYANIEFMTGYKSLVDLTDGRWPSPEPLPDGTIEAVVDEAALTAANILVGDTYTYTYPNKKAESDEDREIQIKLRVVGAFSPKEELYNSPQWLYLPPFENIFFVEEEIFLNELVGKRNLIPEEWVWFWVFDYKKVKVHWLESLVKSLRYIETTSAQIMPQTRLWLSPIRTFEYFDERASVIRLLLFVLSVPILGMVLYYTVLAAGLTVQRRRNEIALLRSRGASAVQVVVSYFIEWCLLAACAYLLGPFLGLGIAQVMGASAGFLSFVDRTALPVTFVPDAYRYAAIAMGVAILACLIPVVGASRYTMVTFRQEAARGRMRATWLRFGWDFILIGVAYYGYRALLKQSSALSIAQAPSDSAMLVDPMLFVAPVVFLVAFGLLGLRFFPWLMQILSFITARWAGVSWALMTRQLSRQPGQYTPLLLLLILTVSLGIYAAATARTLDRNFEDRLRYQYGADVVLTERWVMPGGDSGGSGMEFASAPADSSSFDGGFGFAFDESPQIQTVYEPPFYLHEELPGVIAAARVLTKDVDARIGGNFKGSGTMMAIYPNEFAKVTWYRRDVTPAHLNAYLNLLIKYPEGVLVTREWMQANSLQVGNWISLSIQRQPIDVMIVGAVDYWPTLFPTKEKPFFVTNLGYVQEQYILEPYNVWLKVDRGARLQTIVDELREMNIWVTDVKDARAEIIEGKRSPQRMGLFGILSIGFIVSVMVTLMGFFLYTFLSLRNRILQFGVLRAMGLSVWQLITILALEQLFTVGLGLGIGAYLGAWASRLFLPFLQVSADITGSIPKFIVVVAGSDLVKIFIVLGGMLVISLLILGVLLSRLRLHQAVKLGEET